MEKIGKQPILQGCNYSMGKFWKKLEGIYVRFKQTDHSNWIILHQEIFTLYYTMWLGSFNMIGWIQKHMVTFFSKKI
jgi:hypothetical protein